MSNEYKQLKFKPHLVPLIFSGEKHETWRVADDKELQPYDRLALVNSENGREFARAVVKDVVETTLGEVDISGVGGHEAFESREQMYETFREYYGDDIGPETSVKIVKFSLE